MDLRELRQVAGELEARAAERGVRLSNEIPEGLRVNADSDRLQQVLFNLADNAIKYGRQGGQVPRPPLEDGGIGAGFSTTDPEFLRTHWSGSSNDSIGWIAPAPGTRAARDSA